MPATFDPATLELIDGAWEVDIETFRRDGSKRLRTIWAVVDETDVFVRSWRGATAAWYRSALKSPDSLSLLVDGRQLLVRAFPATDADSVQRCSRAIAQKYAADPAMKSMLRDLILDTTLRLEPR